jgi:hypothetical protein
MKKQTTPRKTKKSKKRSAKHKLPLFRMPKNKHARLALVLVGLIVAALVYAYSIHVARADRLVTIHDRGKERVILTRAKTVQDALKDAHVDLSSQDVTEPALTNELTTTDTVVNIYRARPIIVADGAYRERVMTTALTAEKMLADADLPALGDKDKTKLTDTGDIITDGAKTILTVTRAPAPVPAKPVFAPTPLALTRAKSAQMFTDSKGVVHRETYYDLPMNVVVGACGGGGYTVRGDGAKIDKDGYVLVAANYRIYPKCSVIETSMGPGKVYDTGGFVARYPVGFDLATDWTNYDGR